MRRLLPAMLALAVLLACSNGEGEGDAANTTTTVATPDEETTTTTTAGDEASPDVDAVVAALGAAGLCTDPVAGDPETETLGSLVPTGVSSCTTNAGSAVEIFVYASQDDADEAALVAFDFACSVDADIKFSLLLAGGAVVQIDRAESGGVAPSDIDALAAAQRVLGGDVRQAEC